MLLHRLSFVLASIIFGIAPPTLRRQFKQVLHAIAPFLREQSRCDADALLRRAREHSLPKRDDDGDEVGQMSAMDLEPDGIDWNAVRRHVRKSVGLAEARERAAQRAGEDEFVGKRVMLAVDGSVIKVFAVNGRDRTAFYNNKDKTCGWTFSRCAT